MKRKDYDELLDRYVAQGEKLHAAQEATLAEREACCRDVCAWCEKVGELNRRQEIKPATITDNEQYEHILIWDTDGERTIVRCNASHIRIRQWRLQQIPRGGGRQ